MISRRKFLEYSGAALLAPWSAGLAAQGAGRLPTRPIPGSGESLPIVGFGNSQAFRNGNVDLSQALLDVLLSIANRIGRGGLHGSIELFPGDGASLHLLGRVLTTFDV